MLFATPAIPAGRLFVFLIAARDLSRGGDPCRAIGQRVSVAMYNLCQWPREPPRLTFAC
jgi:hypothetical protein